MIQLRDTSSREKQHCQNTSAREEAPAVILWPDPATLVDLLHREQCVPLSVVSLLFPYQQGRALEVHQQQVNTLSLLIRANIRASDQMYLSHFVRGSSLLVCLLPHTDLFGCQSVHLRLAHVLSSQLWASLLLSSEEVALPFQAEMRSETCMQEPSTVVGPSTTLTVTQDWGRLHLVPSGFHPNQRPWHFGLFRS